MRIEGQGKSRRWLDSVGADVRKRLSERKIMTDWHGGIVH